MSTGAALGRTFLGFRIRVCRSQGPEFRFWDVSASELLVWFMA